MKSVYLMMHRSKPEVRELTRQVVSAFSAVQITVVCEPWLALEMGEEAAKLFQNGDAATFDAVIAVGGDGTLLRANQFAIDHGVPILGINVGRIGFLAEVELEQLPSACQKLKSGDYWIEDRMMLASTGSNGKPLLALNDIVLSRGGFERLIAINAWVDQELVGRYIGDGLIVATPTGSTGYSLSAGGPIVFPGVDCILLSPICAHSLQHRPVVISSKQTVTLELDCDLAQRAQLSADGQKALQLSACQKITVTCAGKQARLIHVEPQDFFKVIRHKLTEWSR